MLIRAINHEIAHQVNATNQQLIFHFVDWETNSMNWNQTGPCKQTFLNGGHESHISSTIISWYLLICCLGNAILKFYAWQDNHSFLFACSVCSCCKYLFQFTSYVFFMAWGHHSFASTVSFYGNEIQICCLTQWQVIKILRNGFSKIGYGYAKP